MSVFKITMHTPSGLQSFECQDDEYILEAAEQAGYDMSYSCRAGACSSCVGKILNGTVDQSDQSFLDDDQMCQGYALLCVSYPTANCTIQSDSQNDFN